MSESIIEDKLNELRSKTQELLQQQPSIEHFMKLVQENVAIVLTLLTYLINVIHHSSKNKNGEKEEHQVKEAAPSTSRKSSLLPPTMDKVVNCADCGLAFIRGSLHDSISKHATQTSCLPFECEICKRRFKSTSSRTKHSKSHSKDVSLTLLKRRSTSAQYQREEPAAKRIRSSKAKSVVTSTPIQEKGHSKDLFQNISSIKQKDCQSD